MHPNLECFERCVMIQAFTWNEDEKTFIGPELRLPSP